MSEFTQEELEDMQNLLSECFAHFRKSDETEQRRILDYLDQNGQGNRALLDIRDRLEAISVWQKARAAA